MIVSISLDDKILASLDKIEKEDGFAGRSEVIRSAINKMISDRNEIENMKGSKQCFIIIKFNEDSEEKISEIKHNFKEIIKTEIHNHNIDHKCVEIFAIEGDSKKIIKLYKELDTSRKIEYIKVIEP